MPGRFHALLLRVYGRLPRHVRRVIVGFSTPSYSVGAMCVIERDDGTVLLVRQSYRAGWGAPGGLLRRREEPAAAAQREAKEEVGVTVDIHGEPHVVIDPHARRIDVVFRCRLRPPAPEQIEPASAEIVEVRWFPRDRLPDMQREVARALAELEARA